MQRLAPNVFAEGDYYPTSSFFVIIDKVFAMDKPENSSDRIDWRDFITNELPPGEFGLRREIV